jgi:hypothetical protein
LDNINSRQLKDLVKRDWVLLLYLIASLTLSET